MFTIMLTCLFSILLLPLECGYNYYEALDCSDVDTPLNCTQVVYFKSMNDITTLGDKKNYKIKNVGKKSLESFIIVSIDQTKSRGISTIIEKYHTIQSKHSEVLTIFKNKNEQCNCPNIEVGCFCCCKEWPPVLDLWRGEEVVGKSTEKNYFSTYHCLKSDNRTSFTGYEILENGDDSFFHLKMSLSYKNESIELLTISNTDKTQYKGVIEINNVMGKSGTSIFYSIELDFTYYHQSSFNLSDYIFYKDTSRNNVLDFFIIKKSDTTQNGEICDLVGSTSTTFVEQATRCLVEKDTCSGGSVQDYLIPDLKLRDFSQPTDFLSFPINKKLNGNFIFNNENEKLMFYPSVTMTLELFIDTNDLDYLDSRFGQIVSVQCEKKNFYQYFVNVEISVTLVETVSLDVFSCSRIIENVTIERCINRNGKVSFTVTSLDGIFTEKDYCSVVLRVGKLERDSKKFYFESRELENSEVLRLTGCLCSIFPLYGYVLCFLRSSMCPFEKVIFSLLIFLGFVFLAMFLLVIIFFSLLLLLMSKNKNHSRKKENEALRRMREEERFKAVNKMELLSEDDFCSARKSLSKKEVMINLTNDNDSNKIEDRCKIPETKLTKLLEIDIYEDSDVEENVFKKKKSRKKTTCSTSSDEQVTLIKKGSKDLKKIVLSNEIALNLVEVDHRLPEFDSDVTSEDIDVLKDGEGISSGVIYNSSDTDFKKNEESSESFESDDDFNLEEILKPSEIKEFLLLDNQMDNTKNKRKNRSSSEESNSEEESSQKKSDTKKIVSSKKEKKTTLFVKKKIKKNEKSVHKKENKRREKDNSSEGNSDSDTNNRNIGLKKKHSILLSILNEGERSVKRKCEKEMKREELKKQSSKKQKSKKLPINKRASRMIPFNPIKISNSEEESSASDFPPKKKE